MARILLVDDDDLLRNTLQQMLELDGHQVTTASHGQMALQCLQRQTVDMVITDMLMPVMDGAQFIVELKSCAPLTPVLAISGGRRALSPEFSLESASLTGANAILPKPFGRAQLQAAVRQVLHGTHSAV